jgi:hypothetical protein
MMSDEVYNIVLCRVPPHPNKIVNLSKKMTEHLCRPTKLQ